MVAQAGMSFLSGHIKIDEVIFPGPSPPN